MYQPKGAKLTGRAAYCDAVSRLPCDILIFARQSCVMSPHKPCVILKVWLVSWSLAHFMTAFLEELHYVLYDIYIGTNIQKFHMMVDFWPNFILNPQTSQKPNSKPQFKFILDWSPQRFSTSEGILSPALTELSSIFPKKMLFGNLFWIKHFSAFFVESAHYFKREYIKYLSSLLE